MKIAQPYPIALGLALMMLLSACSKPLPEDKKAYAGLWENDEKNITLHIHPTGEVNYERKSGSTSVSINAPIKEFQGDDLVVGIWFMTTTFKVNEPPILEEGKWQMVVDEVRLTKNQTAVQ